MALPLWPAELEPAAIVYDCMDELSGFLGAPAELKSRERHLMDCADLVFTGGRSLFEEKRLLHPNVYAFPSGVDVAHFRKAHEAGNETEDPPEYRNIGRPRFGYAGVVDERIDLDLIAAAAEARSDWQFVMVGPVVKIDPNSLPHRSNIHWLGMRPYASLPSYLRGWDAGIMPFALNDATRFISPTKTPEYLAAGLPVLSTAVQDVVRSYGENGFVEIVHNVAEFIECATRILDTPLPAEKRAEIDLFLLSQSWDSVWSRMDALIQRTIDGQQRPVVQTQHVFAGGEQYV
jgi:UDP-galactopyranose mutase